MSDARRALAPHVRDVLTRLRTVVTAMGAEEDWARRAADFLHSLLPAYPEGDVRPVSTPFARLRDAYGLTRTQLDMVVLAGLADEHEGLSHLFRLLHPESRPRPTVGLAMQVLKSDEEQRAAATRELLEGVLDEAGIVRIVGDHPLYDRSLLLADDLWPALNGIDVWPQRTSVVDRPVPTSGLRGWLGTPVPLRVAALLREPVPRVVLVTADRGEVALDRAGALTRQGAIDAVRVALDGTPRVQDLELVCLHALIRDVVALVGLAAGDHPIDLVDPPMLVRPVVVCAAHGTVTVRTRHPLVTLRSGPLRPADRREMWSELLPELAGAAPELASRHPIEPAAATTVAADVRSLVGDRAATVADVSGAIAARGQVVPGGGVTSITPQADWDDLVLTERQRQVLHSAVARLRQQARVLDEWGFLAHRRGARGVRMLFAGPPGTGKTLAAEVLASAIGGLDLLMVDISKIVSKWIGETEKNLSRVFDLAENSVLFFDEADALFGKRTEVSDAHDRYANLETAYLLARLEQFEGLAILATNLKSNIDPAFLRRLEYVVDFREPGPDEREALWRRHVPADAPLHTEVDFPELAARFPVVGGLIRNAVVGAAFLAADADVPIRQEHLVSAMQAEYEKAGLAYPTNQVRSAG